MPQEEHNAYNRYAEELIPTRVQVQRRRGNFLFIFEVDGYKGVNTGEVYYTRDTALEMEKKITSHRRRGIGWVLSFMTPQVALIAKPSSTDESVSQRLVTSSVGPA